MLKKDTHGTEACYSKNKCRCDKCKRAVILYRHNLPIKKHGTVWGYTKGCRCGLCKKAKSNSEYPDKKEPTTNLVDGTRKCIVCGEIKPLEEFHKNSHEFLGRDYRCKPCKNRISRENKNTPKHRFSTYISGAKTRKIQFELTFEEFKTFWNKPCYYCDTLITGIGLDRKDPSKGYQKDNVVPCCAQCNRAKTIQTTDQFIEMCKKVAKKFEHYIVSPS